MKENKDWKKELKDLYNSCGFDHVSNCGCFGECNCVDNLTKLENFIEQIISQEKEKCIKEEVFAFMRHLQEKANTLPPNLLLNEVVNYAYDRVNLLQNK